jgi:hypothetical protein
MDKLIIYQVWIVSWSCDINASEWGDKYFTTKTKAEDYILDKGLLDMGYESVDVIEIEVNA